ncbi:MAG TPA: response regulator, partial [Burkholderiales bacterium]|nr:response regulator [Burkholderiales bacterium]
ETDAELILHHLRRCGLTLDSSRVWTEADFLEALATFVPNIILSDYSMPAFDGLRALGLVRERAPGTPFIFVSGSIRPQDASDALKNGAFDFLLKDDLTRLGPAVEKAVGGVRGRNTPGTDT